MKLKKFSQLDLSFGNLIQVQRETWEQMKQAQLFMVASSLAYTTILSIIPLLAMSFAIFQAFGGLDKLYESVRPFILDNLAEGVSDDVVDRIQHFIENAHGNVLGIGGLIGLIFTSMSMLSSVEKAINRVWAVPLRRSWFQRITSYWFFITLGPIAGGVLLGLASSNKIPLTNILPSWFGGFLILVVGFFLVYKWVPHTKVDWRPALVASSTTALAWTLARMGYTIYTSKVFTYSKIYGSLAAVPILLLWIYIGWLVVLSGAALTAVLQKRLRVN